MANKISIGLRLSPEAVDIIKELAKNLGVSQADIVELAVRMFNQSQKGSQNDLRNLPDQESH